MVKETYNRAETFLWSAINWVGGGALTLLLLFALFTVGPPLETRLFPVTSKISIVTIEPHGERGTDFTFTFEKRRWRDGCELVGFEVFRTDRAFAPGFTPYKVNGKPVTSNAAGAFASSVWRIDELTPAVVQGAVRMEWRHRCHPFWITRTLIYP